MDRINLSEKLSMSENSWTLTLLTERLILRPQQLNDYQAWYAGFAGRFSKQHPYDAGIVDLEGCDLQWFLELCQRHQKLALTDRVYVFGVFLQETNQHLGNIDLSTIRRADNQWANLGYTIQYGSVSSWLAVETAATQTKSAYADWN
jgi:[ribosomal protein S5]-alanine N-acetyltransferase